MSRTLVALPCLVILAAAGCEKVDPVQPVTKKASEPKVAQIQPGPRVQEETQTALIKAMPGDTIEFGAGTFEFTRELSLAVENVTIRGQGMDKTILSFKKQDTGSSGLLVTRGKFRLEDLSIDDTKGDAVKVNGCDDVTFLRLRTRWNGGSKSTNGAYGIYPVQCKNVLVDECVAIAASDAGIYVGQSNNVVVRKCRTEENVAGIEIENCTDADVYDNITTNNAGGLLVFDLPGLEVKNGQRVRVFRNQVFTNNHENFAPKGNMVATVPAGTGIIVMATDHVEVFDNKLTDNQTHQLAIFSFYMTGRPIEDKLYDPIPEAIYVHDNEFKGGGNNPSGDAAVLATLLGKPMPDIIYDGIQNPAKFVGGKLPEELRIHVKNNGKATFANLHWDKINLKDPMGSLARVDRDLKKYEGSLPALAPVSLPGVQ